MASVSTFTLGRFSAGRRNAVEADQRALRALGGIRGDSRRGGALHAGIERRPDLDRLVVVRQDQVELRQRPVGEIADAVLLRRLLDPDGGGVHGRSIGLADEAVVGHRLQDNPRSRTCGLRVGRRRIIGRRLDQAGDDGGFTETEVIGAVAEETA